MGIRGVVKNVSVLLTDIQFDTEGSNTMQKVLTREWKGREITIKDHGVLSEEVYKFISLLQEGKLLEEAAGEAFAGSLGDGITNTISDESGWLVEYTVWKVVGVGEVCISVDN